MSITTRPTDFLGWPFDELPSEEAAARRLALSKAHGDELTEFIVALKTGERGNNCRRLLQAGIPATDGRGYNCVAGEFCTNTWPGTRAGEIAQLMREYIAAGQLELGARLKVGADAFNVYADQSMQPLMLAMLARNTEAILVLLEAGAAEETAFIAEDDGEEIRIITNPEECVASYAAQVRETFGESAALSRITELLMNRKIAAMVNQAPADSAVPTSARRRHEI
ncbi:hypothetical protein ABIC83_002793 [Roseateles asaccharophilus]|uniref:hypothetical protein n=1 Tax=Roseateles asaccharophilus TaxID=582607 RepID=UPI003835C779